MHEDEHDAMAADPTDFLRGLGKPPSYSGDEKDWEEWSFVTRSYLCLIDDTVGQLLEAAESRSVCEQ